MTVLARKYPATKFIKSISTTCIPNYPDKNLPTIFAYFEGEMKAQIVGPNEFNANLKLDDFEWKLHRTGAITSNLNRSGDNEQADRLRSCEDQMVKTIRESIVRKKVDNESDSDDDDGY